MKKIVYFWGALVFVILFISISNGNNNQKTVIVHNKLKESFNTTISDVQEIKCSLGLGFNFGLQYDWGSHNNSKVRRYKVKISIGNKDNNDNYSEYFYYESYVSMMGDLFTTDNYFPAVQDYADLDLTANDNASFSDSSNINHLKIYLLNKFDEAVGKDITMNLKYLKLYNKNDENIINYSGETSKVSTVQKNYVEVYNIPLITTTVGSLNADHIIKADIALDGYVSDYKNNIALYFSQEENIMNGYGTTIEEFYNEFDAELDFLKEQGFKSVRLPVAWYPHMNSEGDIDPEWIEEVKKAVNKIINRGFYAIINIHQEGMKHGRIKADANEFAKIENWYKKLVNQIAVSFKDYNNHLVLAGPNEVLNYRKEKNKDGQWEMTITSNTSLTDIATSNKINQIFVDEVRKTGGNNETRYLMVSPWFAHGKNLAYYEAPKTLDRENDDPRILTEIHSYNIKQNDDSKTLTTLSYLNNEGKEYLNKYNLVMGEYGIYRTEPLEDRIKFMESNITLAYELGIPMMIWDEGGNYSIMKRRAAVWDTDYNSDKVVEAMINAYNNSYKTHCSNYEDEPIKKEQTISNPKTEVLEPIALITGVSMIAFISFLIIKRKRSVINL